MVQGARSASSSTGTRSPSVMSNVVDNAIADASVAEECDATSEQEQGLEVYALIK